MKRGILGLVKDPKKQILFSFDQRFGDDLPSSDSDESDYKPSDTDTEVTAAVTHKAKCKKRLKSNNDKVDTVHHNKCPLSDCETINTDIWGQCIPHLVLLKIFHHVVESAGAVPFLCRVQRVCRLWYHCANNSTLWKTVDLSYGWIKANDATLQLLCHTRFSKLIKINLSCWKSLTVDGLKLLADTCPQLKSIDLSCCRVNSVGVLYMINQCSNLSEIDLTSYGCTDVVSAKMIVQIVNKCSGNLQSLNLSRNSPKGYSAVLKAIAACCPNLQCLDLSQNHDSYIPLNFDIERLQHGCPKLRILRLVNTVIEPARVSVCGRNESPGFPELQELSLGMNNPAVTVRLSGQNDILQRLVKTSQNLRSLDLRGWSQLTCADLHNVPATDLAELCISGFSTAKDDTVETVGFKWQHSLVQLDVSWNVHSESALDIAMRKLASNPATSKLEVLDLTGTRISLGSVQSLLQGCPMLRNLNLSSCRGLPRGMKREYFNESLECLRKNIDSLARSNVAQ